MIKAIAFLTRLSGTSREAFRDYYENCHAPKIASLLPMLAVYERNYPDASKVRPADGQSLDEAIGFDAMTVMKFVDRDAFRAWKAALADPATLAIIRTDEANFLDHTQTRLFVVDECVNA
ncbi:MAG: EthD domain-containing protein [Sphingomonadales bacterium]|nr:EthD domain-containing protein [Sphingomonadales bacterium]